MLACKETAVLHFAALAAAALLYWLWNLRRKSLRDLWRLRTLLTAIFVFLLLGVILFTWFGTNWSALAALNHAAPNFAARAGGEGHAQPFWYYAHLLAGGRSGALICALACIGVLLAVRKREVSPFALLAYYAVFVFVLYSAIPYKTSWLALNFWLPIALLAGLAAASLGRVPVRNPAVGVALGTSCLVAAAVASMLIAHDTRQRVFLHPADEGNPYAYAHTSEDLLGLPAELAEMVHQEGLASPLIAVIAADPWPLPWYLRQYAQVGYWQPGQSVGQADFYITSTDAANQYANQLKNFHADFFGERPGVLILLWSPATQ
jgi:predicted membrane-bound mannosyltransferase